METTKSKRKIKKGHLLSFPRYDYEVTFYGIPALFDSKSYKITGTDFVNSRRVTIALFLASHVFNDRFYDLKIIKPI